jgi:hypothetical protein
MLSVASRKHVAWPEKGIDGYLFFIHPTPGMPKASTIPLPLATTSILPLFMLYYAASVRKLACPCSGPIKLDTFWATSFKMSSHPLRFKLSRSEIG